MLLCAASTAHAQSPCGPAIGNGWHPDPNYQPLSAEPTYPDDPPRVTAPTLPDPDPTAVVSYPREIPYPRIAVDATHDNVFTVGPPNCRYYPLAQALGADGAVAADQRIAFDPLQCVDPTNGVTCAYRRALSSTVDILVIANPRTAISAAEATAIAGWLGVPGATTLVAPGDDPRRRGLILLADRQDGFDHPARIAALAAKLGLSWSSATEADHLYRAGAAYALNPFHPVTRGWKGSHEIESVQTFSGVSLGAAGGTPLDGKSALSLPSPAGASQGFGFEIETGRVYAGADPEMFTAQVLVNGSTSQAHGMQTHPDNEKLLRNIVHWLDDLCPTQNPYFEPQVDEPTYPGRSGPRIAVDSSHGNYHTIAPNRCTYLPFAQLLRADGSIVEDFATPFDELLCGDPSDLVGCAYVDALRSVDILAMTSPGVEIPDAEAALLEGWLRGDVACDDPSGCAGRGLLLINDHAPYPQAITTLSARLGLDWPSTEDYRRLEFEPPAPGLETLLNTEHVTTQGFDSSERVEVVTTFANSYFGETIEGSLLGESILTYAPGSDATAGSSVGWAFDHGLGRVYASGEQAMFTSRLHYLFPSEENPDGEMGLAAFPDNAKYLLNIVHWMDGLLPDEDGDGLHDQRDNCAIAENPLQADRGGVATTAPDAIGDACQCGDVSGDGIVAADDVDAIRSHGLGIASASFVVGGNCDVTGNGWCNGQDANAVGTAIGGAPSSSFGQRCQNADPGAPPCSNCTP